MLSKKYTVSFFAIFISILLLLLYIIVHSSREVPLSSYFDYSSVLIPILVVVLLCIAAIFIFEGRGLIRLRYLSIGIYTAKRYWIDENKNVFIVCCKGRKFEGSSARIIRAETTDFIGCRPSEFLKDLEKDIPVQFFVTKCKKAENKKIYSPEVVLNIEKFDEFVLG